MRVSKITPLLKLPNYPPLSPLPFFFLLPHWPIHFPTLPFYPSRLKVKRHREKEETKMVFRSVLVLLLLIFSVSGGSTAADAAEECNFFAGSWVVDESYPLYTAASCPFVEHEFSCVKNGRPDLGYTKYRWQPLDCDLTR